MTANLAIREALDLQRAGGATIVPVILCGGSGSRLWPVSRKDMAKQHVPILGGASPFQRTLARLDGALFGTPIVISSAASRFMIAEQAAELETEVEIALEPQGRDTLAAVTLAACLAARRDPSATVLVLPSDQLVGDVDAFHATVAEAARLAEDGHIVMLGVSPTRPSTGFGYIARGESLTANAHAVERFVEKPDAARAAELIGEGWLWNAGMFCFRAQDGIREVEQHAPEALTAVRRAIEEASVDLGALLLGASFAAAPKISFDHAVMERTTRAAVVAADFDWSDIGDWKGVWERSARDDRGVAREGRVHAHDVSNCYLRSDGRLLCALGVEGLAIVDTVDAVLVAPIERSNEVKALVRKLEAAASRRRARRRECIGPGAGTRRWTLATGFRVKRIW